MEEKNDEKERSDSFKKTAVPVLAGLVCGIISFLIGGGDPFFKPGVMILILSIMMQHPIYIKIGVTAKSAKDWFYISFLTFNIWFVSWAVLLMAR